MAHVNGYCDPKFEKVRNLLARNLASGAELGAAICVNIKGENVVDLWGGATNESRSNQWQENTIVNVWSVSKAITCLSALMVVDRGLLDVHEKVSKYWPEFAENGKEDVEVRHLLSHTSGVSGWEQPITFSDVFDRDRSTAKLATQAPWFQPGTVSGYHAMTMGHLVGELIRRTTGKSLKEFIEEEIAGPLGADFQLGAREEDWPRISALIPPSQLNTSFNLTDKDSVAYRTLMGPIPNAQIALTDGWRRAEIGAANGHGNARAIARILAMVSLGGEVDGVRFLSPGTIDLIFQEQCDGIDLVLGIPLRFGIGYALPKRDTVPWIPEGRKCFWGGWGGSIAIMDLDNAMTISYTMNKMADKTLGNANTAQYVQAIYEIVEGGL
ncbi:serine hydrolase domain-containing protein [Aspergillus alliaceus]|uniref:serine hydrolase domain-containing protein n=1 Tax=Petromyces alliaceus TaxID=209559 RepID=UPI0012A62108|nr:beta-lactamase/transpeptidase-like protein [Aspergillus alliaceus]KAB8239017.1 beta-lactamase/transpeptidase-like protein [Aspergillus alliaceus]